MLVCRGLFRVCVACVCVRARAVSGCLQDIHLLHPAFGIGCHPVLDRSLGDFCVSRRHKAISSLMMDGSGGII